MDIYNTHTLIFVQNTSTVTVDSTKNYTGSKLTEGVDKNVVDIQLYPTAPWRREQ